MVQRKDCTMVNISYILVAFTEKGGADQDREKREQVSMHLACCDPMDYNTDLAVLLAPWLNTKLHVWHQMA